MSAIDGGTPGGSAENVEVNMEHGNVSNKGTPVDSSRKKRKANPESPVLIDFLKDENETRAQIMEALQKVSGAIMALYSDISEAKNIKKDIKEKTEILQDMNRMLVEGLVMKHFSDQLASTTLPAPPVQTEQVGRMRYFCDRCSIELDQEEEERKEIRAKLTKVMKYDQEQYEEFIDRKWPVSAYEKTKETVGNPLSGKEGDLFIFIKEKKEDTTLMSMVRTRYPEVEDILMEEEEDGERLHYLESTVSTKRNVNRRRIHLIETKGEKDLRAELLKLKNENMIKGGKKITAAVSEPEFRVIVRKALEILFVEDEGLMVDFFIPKSSTTRTAEVTMGKRERKPEAVVIKTNVSTYAETLRSIRAVIDPEGMGVGIKSVKLTKDNNVVIVTEEGKADMLHKEIATKVKGVETKVTGNNTNVMILDVDASMSGKEIEEYIRKETKEFETEVRSVRTSKAGTQVATVSMPKRTASMLLSEGDIKIGWTRCRVKPKVDVMRCYNCLKLGHHSDICRETRVEKRCLNCAQHGHMARECTSVSYCTTCESTGHRCDSTLCPSFRKLIQEMRVKSIPERETEKDEVTHSVNTVELFVQQDTDMDIGEEENTENKYD
ncbi:hypothetical protein M8J77_006252 [Diaphorina citri]|nr:hypothetical protein M8J77_006252 [Diaphorina citri]